VPDGGRPMRPKHVAVLVIKSWETKSCVELVGTDWKQLCTHTTGWETQRVHLPTCLLATRITSIGRASSCKMFNSVLFLVRLTAVEKHNNRFQDSVFEFQRISETFICRK
jgi:hypothetical protein